MPLATACDPRNTEVGEPRGSKKVAVVEIVAMIRQLVAGVPKRRLEQSQLDSDKEDMRSQDTSDVGDRRSESCSHEKRAEDRR